MLKKNKLKYLIISSVALLSSAFLFSQTKMTAISPEVEKSGRGEGCAYDIVKAVFAEMGEEVEIENSTPNGVLTVVSTASSMAVFPVQKTPETFHDVFYSDPIGYANTLNYYKLADADVEIESATDLKKYKVGVIIGAPGYRDFEDMKGYKVTEYGTPFAALKALLSKDIDVLICDETLADNTLVRGGDSGGAKFKKLNAVYETSAVHLAFIRKYKGSSSMLKKFNTALEKFKQTKEYESIKKSYGIK